MKKRFKFNTLFKVLDPETKEPCTFTGKPIFANSIDEAKNKIKKEELLVWIDSYEPNRKKFKWDEGHYPLNKMPEMTRSSN
jgi:hypothetical protein